MNASADTFEGLGIDPKILSILTELGMTTPTPIQQKSIPQAIEGKDVIGVAQTGTGKTLAFGVPLMQKIAKNDNERALILLPTRELALQVHETLGKIAKHFNLRGAILMGGAAMGPQVSDLRRDPHVIISTPGRLLDHMESGTIKLNKVSILVLDEADRMLDMGFWPQVKRIMSGVTGERQTMLFSATLSKEIMEVATKQMKTPVSIEVAPPGTTAERVTQEFFVVHRNDKSRLLEKILSQYSGSTLVFSRTKHGAKKILRDIIAMGHKAAEIHGNRSLAQRREALEGFKSGRYRILVATDIASRGIDVKGIELVVNYDLPMDSADYVHRIGRTARAGAEGHAISFAMPDQKRDIRDIERLIRMPLQMSEMPELPPSRFTQPAAEGPRSYGRPQFGQRAQVGFGGRGASRGGSRSRSYGPSRPGFGSRRKSGGRGAPKRAHHSRRESGGNYRQTF